MDTRRLQHYLGPPRSQHRALQRDVTGAVQGHLALAHYLNITTRVSWLASSDTEQCVDRDRLVRSLRATTSPSRTCDNAMVDLRTPFEDLKYLIAALTPRHCWPTTLSVIICSSFWPPIKFDIAVGWLWILRCTKMSPEPFKHQWRGNH